MVNNKIDDNIKIKIYINEIQKSLLRKNNVIGVGIGNKIVNKVNTGEKCISVFVSKKINKILLNNDDLIPQKINEFKTDVIEIGNVQTTEAFKSNSSIMRKCIRPVIGGCSIGHYMLDGAGSLGTCVYDNRSIDNKCCILSNNHVLAYYNEADIGDPILQPAVVDGGMISRDTIAYLSRYVPIRFMTSRCIPVNYVDAAIAVCDSDAINNKIYKIGCIRGINNNPRIGDIVQKAGRSTDYTIGKIIATDAAFNIKYSKGRAARFVDQIVATTMGKSGDSGSIVCDTKGRAVGLLFAGAQNYTIINRMLYVLRLLDIRLYP